MSLHDFLRGLKRFAVVTTILLLFVFLAIVGAEHIIYDHLLFGLLK